MAKIRILQQKFLYKNYFYKKNKSRRKIILLDLFF